MDNGGSVPIWAFILTTAVALCGPLMGTWLANRNSQQRMAAQHSHDRAMYLLDKKHEVYDDALASFGQATLRLLATQQALLEHQVEMQVTVERLRMLAPPEVVVTAFVARSTLKALYRMEWQDKGHALDTPAFNEAI